MSPGYAITPPDSCMSPGYAITPPDSCMPPGYAITPPDSCMPPGYAITPPDSCMSPGYAITPPDSCMPPGYIVLPSHIYTMYVLSHTLITYNYKHGTYRTGKNAKLGSHEYQQNPSSVCVWTYPVTTLPVYTPAHCYITPP